MKYDRSDPKPRGYAKHGILWDERLSELGIPKATARSRVRAGRWYRLYPTVISVVHPSLLRPEGHWLAAVKACGAGATLSHEDAAALHQLLGDGPRRGGLAPGPRGGGSRGDRHGVIDVTIPAGRDVRPSGIHVHRSATLRPRDIIVVRQIPVTTVSRTIFDIADVRSPDRLEHVIEQADIAGLLDPAALREQIANNRTRPAATRLEALLDEYDGDLGQAWSAFERMLRAAIRTVPGIPQPIANRQIDLRDGERPIRPDLQWPGAMVAVEADSFRFHKTRAAFERDTRRDQRLIRAGWLPIRVTYRQLTHDPAGLVTMILDLVRERIAA
jgi:hypothetical protein